MAVEVDLDDVYAGIEELRLRYVAAAARPRRKRQLSAQTRRNLSEGVRLWRAAQHSSRPMSELRRVRIERGLTQLELAKRAGLCERTLLLAEARPERLTPRSRRALARALTVHPRELRP